MKIGQDNEVYSLYTPLRNRVREYNLLDGLYVIWGFARNLIFNDPFPFDIQKAPGFDPFGDINNKRQKGIPEFELNFLLKQFILHCTLYRSKKDLKEFRNWGKIVNEFRKLKNSLHKSLDDPSNLFIEFNRHFHDQFKWQNSFRLEYMIRYYKIYNTEELRPIIEAKTGLSLFELFLSGIVYMGRMKECFLCSKLVSNLSKITTETLDKFVDLYSITIEDAKKEIAKHQQMNENLFYSYNPLIAKPILKYEDKYIAPIPIFIYWQVTEGVYYSICKEKGFTQAFGDSFQRYVGEVLIKAINSQKLEFFPEAKYGSPEKRTTDWILLDEEGVVFIECKTKKLTLSAKTSIDIKGGIENDLEKMASFVVQLYKTYFDYKKGEYPQIKYNRDKCFIPLVVTMEDWFLEANPFLLEKLREMVVKNLEIQGIDTHVVDRFPYRIKSCDSFEADIQIINNLGIRKYFSNEYKEEVDVYSKQFIPRRLFENEFKELFIDIRH